MKKQTLQLLSLLLCAAMLAVPTAAASGDQETVIPISSPVEQAAPQAPVLLRGSLNRTEKILKINDVKQGEVVLHTNEKTRILNAVTGEPMALESIANGETVSVYVSPAMTASLPPQTSAILILAKIPADYAVPSFYQVTAVEEVNENGITVSTDQGNQVTIPASAKVGPYLTKNMVRYRDLIPGTHFLMWLGATGTVAEKVLVFPYEGLPFTDVAKDYWANDAISYVTARGVMRADKTLQFAPTAPLTRAEMVLALYRMAGSPVVVQSMPGFTDVQNGGDYISALTWAVGNKLVSGYSDDTFRPDAPVSRQQMAVFLYRWEKHRGGGFKGAWMFLLDYKDRTDISDYAYEGVAWCTTNGILTGRSDGTLAPTETVTRAAAAAMLQRYMSKESK